MKDNHTAVYMSAEDIRSGDLIHLGDGEVFDVYLTLGPYFKHFNRFNPEKGAERPGNRPPRVLVNKI